MFILLKTSIYICACCHISKVLCSTYAKFDVCYVLSRRYACLMRVKSNLVFMLNGKRAEGFVVSFCIALNAFFTFTVDFLAVMSSFTKS